MESLPRKDNKEISSYLKEIESSYFDDEDDIEHDDYDAAVNRVVKDLRWGKKLKKLIPVAVPIALSLLGKK